MDISELDTFGSNAPEIIIEYGGAFPSLPKGVTKLLVPVGRGIRLETLFINRGGDLVAHFHGALDRSKYKLPRFERLATLREIEPSTLLISDPTLELDAKVQLAWYVGWPGLDLPAIIGWLIRNIRQQLRSHKTILAGSSGGGFAALHTAVWVQDCNVLVYNPQTSITRYLVEGQHIGPQRMFALKIADWASCVDPWRMEPGGAWARSFGDRVDMVARYSEPLPLRIWFVQNRNDFSHWDGHYKPFLAAVRKWIQEEDLVCSIYDGPRAHVAPTPQIFLTELLRACQW